MDLQGLDLSTLDYDLPEAPPQPDPYTDTVPDKEARLRAALTAEEWDEHYWKGWTWKEYGHRVEVEHLRRAFSFSEMIRIWAAEVVQSEMFRYIETEHPVLEKVRHSTWHFGHSRADYNVIARTVSGLRSLAWPGFDLRLAYVSKYRADGWAENVSSAQAGRDLWVDNDFGLLVHHAGRHVLTVGFGVGASGVFVSQAQLREKKGNRWLYKLGGHYLDVALDVLARAFGDRLWLVEGRSAAEAVRRSYGKSPCSMTSETEARIVALYDRPLGAWDRTGETEQHEGRRYVKLARKAAVEIDKAA